LAAYHFDSHTTIASEKSKGARDSASTPPASTRSERARANVVDRRVDRLHADAQLRITVQPGTFCPQPMRSAATRPMLTSSADGAAQPRMTSSSSSGAKRWRRSSVRPASVANRTPRTAPDDYAP